MAVPGTPGIPFISSRGVDNRLHAVSMELSPSPSASDLDYLEGELLDLSSFPPAASSDINIMDPSYLEIESLMAETAELEAELENMKFPMMDDVSQESEALEGSASKKRAEARAQRKQGGSTSAAKTRPAVNVSSARRRKEARAAKKVVSAKASPSQGAPASQARQAAVSRRSKRGRSGAPVMQAVATRKGIGATSTFGGDSGGVSGFMNGMGPDRKKLLTAAEEVDYSNRVKQLTALLEIKSGLEEASGLPVTEEAWAAAAGYSDTSEFMEEVQECTKARHLIINCNRRLVMSVCRNFMDRGLSTEDLVSEGMQGIMKAASKFDPSKGFRFSTYCHWWIRQAVSKAVAEQTRIVRLPSHLHDLNVKVLKSTSMLKIELGRFPTDAEVAQHVGITLKKLENLKKATLSAQSSDVVRHSDSDNGDTILDGLSDDSQSVDELTVDHQMKEDVHNVLETMDPKAAEILRLRFGLGGSEEHTLEQVGKLFGVTRERIRQIEIRAIRNLRDPQRTSALDGYTDEEVEINRAPGVLR
eukprot:CAMPEP_0117675090 /NCGR_PEP_ID=MMETSP0804-20121206/15411_1 /TAXON_ID=1074897 /ORGANISM="Tetraselmis astigmatica, Strain CCMP880" /LENGTH=530 /DNA_ID=CAMNT_0005484053 /DNA_START=734 /DNA_END=2326 /DNA_ORIENTATION=-